MPRKMLPGVRLALIVVVCGLSFINASSNVHAQGAKPKINYREPAREYVELQVDSRVFQVEKQLVDEDEELATAAVERLKARFDEALAIFPEHSREGLQDMPLFVLYGPKATHGGRPSGMAYFRKEAPTHRKDIDPRWGRSVVVYSADNYVKLRDLWAIKGVVHELAHAYHLEHWPEKEQGILTAWENAMARGLYHGVKNDQEKVLDKAYATVNQLEYFAELTCMYFVRCDYHPFDRRQLAAYDPAGHAMIEKYWKPPKEYELRTWTDRSGKFSVKAKFKSAASGKITLVKEDDSEITVESAVLSEEDRSYLRDLQR